MSSRIRTAAQPTLKERYPNIFISKNTGSKTNRETSKKAGLFSGIQATFKGSAMYLDLFQLIFCLYFHKKWIGLFCFNGSQCCHDDFALKHHLR